ncbi:MAG: hypothetical protein FWH57_11780, partial [Oscillospiraceae bacterium]|nr:hypothetical protein [Oscillospiraceae bacterium]
FPAAASGLILPALRTPFPAYAHLFLRQNQKRLTEKAGDRSVKTTKKGYTSVGIQKIAMVTGAAHKF